VILLTVGTKDPASEHNTTNISIRKYSAELVGIKEFECAV
jgi:hypothetical protein